MSRVFVIEEGRHDMSDAERFGPVIALFKPRELNYLEPEDIVRRVEVALAARDFDQTTDYICLSGYMVACAFAMVALSRIYESFHVLIFDAQKRTYTERMIGASQRSVYQRLDRLQDACRER